MSEKEKLEQIGALVEEVSHRKGKLAHVTERFNRAGAGYAFVAQNWPNFYLDNGQIRLRNSPGRNFDTEFDALMNKGQLHEIFVERDKLVEEIKEIEERLKPLAPHLFQR